MPFEMGKWINLDEDSATIAKHGYPVQGEVVEISYIMLPSNIVSCKRVQDQNRPVSVFTAKESGMDQIFSAGE